MAKVRVDNPTTAKKPVDKKVKRSKLLYRGLLFVSVVLIFTGLFLIVSHKNVYSPPHKIAQQQKGPSANKPSKMVVDNYVVAPDLPRYISAPEISVPKTRVIQLGLLKNSQIASPSNIYDAGWYNGSAKPGQTGAMFVYAHVSSWTANGVFYKLKNLVVGDKVTIERGDGKKFNYTVVVTKIYPYNHVDMNSALAPVNGVAQGMNLMTCTGHVIKGTSEFDERLVVYTSLAT